MPWDWKPVAFVFHVSMFFGLVACYSIVSNGLTFHATERVEAHVVNNIEKTEEVNINAGEEN